MTDLDHPITHQSFAIIDREMGELPLNNCESAIARRVIHATADFEFARLLHFSPGAIESAIAALQNSCPIVTDVNMVKQGIVGMVAKTFNNPLFAAIDFAAEPLPGKTRTETGLLRCWEQYPQALYAIGNAPTALLALCECCTTANVSPALVVGAPVGFVSVIESKQALARLPVAQIRVEGRKGGSPIAAAIINALLVLAWERATG